MKYLAVIVAFLALATAAAPLPGPGLIRVSAETISSQRHGGVIVQTSLIFNRLITSHAIGSANVLCRYIGKGGPLGNGTFYCEAVYSLPHGRITATGLIKKRSYYVLAVTGGTGLYSNVGGEVVVSTYAYSPRQERLLFGLEAIG